MSLFLRRLQQIRAAGPVGAARLIASRVGRGMYEAKEARREATHASGEHLRDTAPRTTALVQKLPLPDSAWSSPRWLEPALRHEFDLLGSGRVHVPAPLPEERDRVAARQSPEQRRWVDALESLLPPSYERLDWHLDFKSGFRWDAARSSRELTFADRPGADVKVPWELARMQHLPGLALGAIAHAGDELGARCAAEVRHQIIDFAAANPPRRGVNWICAMDVGIRAANWVFGEWILRAGGIIDETLRRVLHASLLDHARHIVGHLEWSPHLRSNHYLADIVGLLAAAAWLPTSSERDRWVRVAARDLLYEIECQFDSDGANFEASTSYHRLSAEMAMYGVAMLLAIDAAEPGLLSSGARDRIPHPAPHAPALRSAPQRAGSRLVIPDAVLRRLVGMGRFTRAILRDDRRAAQIGDNDSGRFLKLHPSAGSRGAPHECGLDHRHLLDAARGLFATAPLDRDSFETRFMRALVGEAALAWPPGLHALDASAPPFERFDAFGLFVWRSARLHLIVRCGSVGQNGNGGHAHSDQLSFDLAVDGSALIVDNGTYVYTPQPDERNRFRSAASHNVLSIDDREPNDWHAGAAGLFQMTDRSRGEVLGASAPGFIGRHAGFRLPWTRRIAVESRSLQFIDELPPAPAPGFPGSARLSLHLAPGVTPRLERECAVLSREGRDVARVAVENGATLEIAASRYSAAYGEIEATAALHVRPIAREVRWSITV